MQNWEEMHRTSSCQPVPVSSNILLAAGFQHHSLSKTEKNSQLLTLICFQSCGYGFSFYSKIHLYLPNSSVRSTLIDYSLFCKVHGSSQFMGILGLKYSPPTPKIYTMVGKTICLFRKQPKGCCWPVIEPPCPSSFGKLLLAKESSKQARGSSLTSCAPTVTALWKLNACLIVWHMYDSLPHPTGNSPSLVFVAASL